MESWLNLSWITLETLAVVLAFGYLAFAIQENSLCWYFVFFSAAIYVWIFFDARLYMVSLLNVYYVLMSLYGWQQWRRGGTQQIEHKEFGMAVYVVKYIPAYEAL